MTQQKMYLSLSGILLIVIGSYIALATSAYLTQFGVIESRSVDFFSELRGMGGGLVGYGLLALCGVFNRHLEKTALVISMLVFCTFSMFRVLSIVLDGMPSQGVLMALLIEVVFALWGLALLRRDRQTHGLSAYSKAVVNCQNDRKCSGEFNKS